MLEKNIYLVSLETNLFQGQVDTNNEDEDQVFAGNLYFDGET